jgi:hypothetical protein
VEPDSYEESFLAAHSDGNFCIKEEYVAEEPFSSEDPENVSLKILLYIYIYIYIYTQNIPFIVSLSTAALSHRKRASTRTSRNSCCIQGHHKRDILCV